MFSVAKVKKRRRSNRIDYCGGIYYALMIQFPFRQGTEKSSCYREKQ